jgi:hypothetical protein
VQFARCPREVLMSERRFEGDERRQRGQQMLELRHSKTKCLTPNNVYL